MNMATPISFKRLSAKTISTFFLLNIASADLTKTLGSAGLQNGTARDVTLGGLFTAVERYGCWCYLPPDSDYRSNARGRAVDQMDSFCKVLINGYKCATFDAENNGEASCDAQTVPFNFPNIFLGTQTEDFATQCITLNPGSVCAQRACQIEIVFVLPLFCEAGVCQISSKFTDFQDSDMFDSSLVHISAGGTVCSNTKFNIFFSISSWKPCF